MPDQPYDDLAGSVSRNAFAFIDANVEPDALRLQMADLIVRSGWKGYEGDIAGSKEGKMEIPANWSLLMRGIRHASGNWSRQREAFAVRKAEPRRRSSETARRSAGRGREPF